MRLCQRVEGVESLVLAALCDDLGLQLLNLRCLAEGDTEGRDFGSRFANWAGAAAGEGVAAGASVEFVTNLM